MDANKKRPQFNNLLLNKKKFKPRIFSQAKEETIYLVKKLNLKINLPPLEAFLVTIKALIFSVSLNRTHYLANPITIIVKLIANSKTQVKKRAYSNKLWKAATCLAKLQGKITFSNSQFKVKICSNDNKVNHLYLVVNKVNHLYLAANKIQHLYLVANKVNKAILN